MPASATLTRRLLSAVVGAAVVSTSLLVVPASAQGTAPDAAAGEVTTLQPVQARPADQLVDAYGVNIHPTYGGTPYRNQAFVLDRLRALGARHVRTGMNLARPDLYRMLADLNAAGIKSDLILGRPDSSDTPAELVASIARNLPAGSVSGLEGANEWNLSGDPDWAVNLRRHQAEVYAAAKANPQTADVPVLAPALGLNKDFAVLGDLTAVADVGNNHLYPGAMPPSSRLDGALASQRLVVGDKPVVFTESGYHNGHDTSEGHFPTPEPVVGVYAPRLLLEHFSRGVRRSFTYELVDQYADPAKIDHEANFGLLRNDLTPKPAYTAMQNLLRLLADPGPAFAPRTLSYLVDGADADLRQVLLQKRDGRFYLMLWRDVSVYDRRTEQDLTVDPEPVSVQLGTGADVKVFRPSTSPLAVSSSTGGHTVTVPLSGEVVALEITPTSAVGAPAAPRAVSAAPADRAATVRWSPAPYDGGSPVTGYRLQASPGGATTTVGATAREARIGGLTNGVAYTFSAVALNAQGASAAAAGVAATPRTVPAPPADVRVEDRSGAAVLTWSAPGSDGGAPVTGYRVDLAPGGASVQLGAAARATTLGNLTNGATYTATVVALNEAGESAPAVVPVAPRTVPGAPADVLAAPLDDAAEVRWSPPVFDGGSAVTEYRVQAAPGGATAVVDGSSLAAVVPGLANGTSYVFTVVAVNAAGASGRSPYSPRVTPRTVPGAPLEVSAAPRDGAAQVSWAAPASTGGSALTGFRVESVPGGASVDVGPGARTANVAGLDNGTAYVFRVVASNVAGTSVASAPSAATPRTVPAAPGEVLAVPGNGTAALRWAVPDSDGGSPVTGYRLTVAPGDRVLELPSAALGTTVTGLDNGTSYTFRVAAQNAAGTSPLSVGVRAVPRTVPGAPHGVTAVAQDGAALVSWSAPASDGGSPVTSYRVQASSGGAVVRVAGGAGSATVGGLTNGTAYDFTVVAVSAAGESPASAASAPVTPLVPPVVLQESALRVGGWRSAVVADAPGGRTSRTPGDTATLAFTGTSVAWRTEVGPDLGRALVLIDGVSRGEVDLYRATSGPRTVGWTGLAPGSHVLTVEVLGRKAAASSAAFVPVGGFVAGGTVVDVDAAAVAYNGWSTQADPAASGGARLVGGTAGRSASLAFTGSAVEWVTATGPGYGLAEVVLDGVSLGVVDLSAVTGQPEVRRTFSGLGAGPHTLTLEVLGRPGARGTGTQVSVDALLVHR